MSGTFMNLPTAIAGLCVLALSAVLVRELIREHRAGGCAACNSCGRYSGGCSGCCTTCQERESFKELSEQ